MPLSSQLHTLCPRRGSGFSFFPTVNWFCLYLVFIQTEHAVRTRLHLASFPQYTMSLFTYSFMCLLFVLLPHHWTRSSWELQRGPVHWLAPSTLPRYVAQSRGSIRAGWMCSSGGQRLHSFQKNAFKKIKYKNDTQIWSLLFSSKDDAFSYTGSIFKECNLGFHVSNTMSRLLNVLLPILFALLYSQGLPTAVR